MHVVVNETLVRNRVRLASVAHFTALAVFAVGLWISTSRPDQPESIVASYTSIVIGLLLYNFGQIYLRRWGPRFRQDSVLAKAFKGLDDRYTLLAFASTKLPDYILVGPNGVHVIVPRIHAGQIACRGNRWTQEARRGLGRIFSFFGGTPLGDPGADVARGIRAVRERLSARGVGTDGSELPVGGVVVFTNPAAKLRIEGCTQTVTQLKQLRNYVRGSKGALGSAVARVVRALEA